MVVLPIDLPAFRGVIQFAHSCTVQVNFAKEQISLTNLLKSKFLELHFFHSINLMIFKALKKLV